MSGTVVCDALCTSSPFPLASGLEGPALTFKGSLFDRQVS